MSLMQLVREKYKSAIKPPDKTDGSPFVSIGSPSYEQLKIQFPDLARHEVPTVIEMLRIQEQRVSGVIPDHYTSVTECQHCGPVPIRPGCPSRVLGCPWCLNRVSGSPMPALDRPTDRPAERDKRQGGGVRYANRLKLISEV